ncbi:MAG: histidine kinase [Anaerolineae bacterium]|jgi:signal transduction histidine kinase
MSFLKRFASLRWKLVVSYVAVTLLTVLALELIVILAADWFGPPLAVVLTRQTGLDRARRLADLVAAPLADDSPARVAQALKQPVGLVFQIIIADEADLEGNVALWGSETRVVIEAPGHVVASNQPERYPVASPFAEPGLPEAERLVAAALTDGSTSSHMAQELDVFAVAVPINDAEGTRLGALYYRQPLLDASQWSLRRLGEPLLTTTLLLLPCMIPLGLVFGFATATGFTRRLRRLSEASDALAHGDLGRRVHDQSQDEIGQLARQFNTMAGQIESDTAQLRALAERNARLARQAQKLAALEERHRLARELHDGVKQHLFGVNLSTATALNLLDADPEQTRAKLQEIKRLSRQAQAEMVALLNELRPVGLEEGKLVDALKDYLRAYERREGIEVDWQTSGELSLPPAHEQALFRVAQEALTNVARHAQATQVRVELHATPEAVTLQVADDGRGFDPAAIQAASTMGLQGMRERLAGLGGALTLDTLPGAGVRLKAWLPRPAHIEEESPHA